MSDKLPEPWEYHANWSPEKGGEFWGPRGLVLIYEKERDCLEIESEHSTFDSDYKYDQTFYDFIPLKVLASFLSLHGYEVLKKI